MGLFDRFKAEEKEYQDTDIVALANAKVVPNDQIKDNVFATEMLGQTIAFDLQDEIVVAPCNGTLEVMFPTGHAFGIRRKDGMAILVHVGINTVNLKGKGFKVYAKQGDQVKAGQKLVKVSSEWIKDEGYDLTTMMIITEPLDKDKKLEYTCKNNVSRGQVIYSANKKEIE